MPLNTEDMQKHLNHTRDLVKTSKFEEALERHIWFHNNSLKHDPAMYGVRLSFALSDWKRLGDKYPPALKALMKIRNDKTEVLLKGKKNRHIFHDIVSINKILGEANENPILFEKIDKNHPENALEYWHMAKESVIAAKLYDLAWKFIKNALADYTRVKAMYDENVKLYNDPRIGEARFKTYNQNSFVKECLELIEVSVAIGKSSAAREIQMKALSVVEDDRLKKATTAKGQ